MLRMLVSSLVALLLVQTCFAAPAAELDLRAALRGVKRQEATPTAVALANDTIAALNSTDLGAATVTTAAAVLNATAVTVTQTVTVTDLASAKNGTAKGDKKKDKGKGKDKKGKKGGKKDAEKNGTAKATEAADAGMKRKVQVIQERQVNDPCA